MQPFLRLQLVSIVLLASFQSKVEACAMIVTPENSLLLYRARVALSVPQELTPLPELRSVLIVGKVNTASQAVRAFA